MVKNVAFFSSLSKYPITHGFSWGREAENMSEAFDDSILIRKRVADFLVSLKISPNLPIIRISPDNPNLSDPNILELNKEILNRKLSEAGEIEVSANSIFTKEKNLVLTVKPADCAICIIYFENKNNEKFVGLIHCSAWETNKLLPFNSIKYLIKEKFADPKNINIGITPAISQEFFYINEGEIKKENWKGFIKIRNGKIFIDIAGNVIKQLKDAGIPKKNIEANRTDTFSQALVGKTFSHRLSRDENFPEGRFIVAVKLN